MKRITTLTILALSLIISLASCESEDKGKGSYIDNKEIEGEWICQNGNEINYFDLRSGLVLKDHKGYEIGLLTTTAYDSITGQGSWSMIDGKLRLKYTSTYSGKLSTYDYTVSNISTYGFEAYNAEIGVTYKFMRVAVNRTTKVGDTFQVVIPKEYNEFHPTSYSSSDSRIADVDSEGNVTIKKCGTAFIFATSSEGTLVAKVDTPLPAALFPNYVEDVFMNINDFSAKYEKYHSIGDINYSNGTYSILLTDHFFEYNIVYFDLATGDIYTIFYKLKDTNKRNEIANYLSQIMVAVVNNSGNTVWTDTGSLTDFTFGAYFSEIDGGLLLRFINNNWYSKKSE